MRECYTVPMTVIAQKKNSGAENERSADGSAAERIDFSPLAELEKRYALMRDRLGASAADDPDCELLRLQVEVAKAEHDPAGALKFENYVRKNRELFLPAPETEGGKGYRVAEGAENRRYLLVSMGEMGRLNKEGHKQAAGDAGLEAVVRAARAAIGGRAGVSVYRYDSSEYMIEFDDASAADVERFEESFRNQELDLGAYRDIEAPPLTFVRVEFADILDILDSVDLARSETGEMDAHEAAAESVTWLKRFSSYDLEVGNFMTRVKRAVDKLRAVREGDIAREKAEAFFDTYLKKDFYGSELDSLAAIEDLWQDGADHEDFERAVELMAVAAAKRKFADDRWFEVYERHLANNLAREYLRLAGIGAEDRYVSDPFDADKKLAKIPDQQRGTEGLRLLSRKKERIGRRKGKWLAVDELDHEAESRKRDKATGLLGRGKFYEDVDSRIVLEQPTSLIFIDLGFLKYFNNAGRRAVGDAAVLKAVEVMEQAVAESGKKAEIYRYGGDEFVIMVEGDAKDAEMLKEHIERIRFEAGRIPDLRSLREQGYAEESIGDSRSDYAPMELVLDYGISDLKGVGTLFNDLEEGGLMDEILMKSRRSREALVADILVKTADAAVGYQKASRRFKDLLALMAKPGYADESSIEHKRTEAVIAASRKAIFAEHGGEEALRLWALQKPENVDKLIDEFVADRLEKMEAIFDGKKELVDKLVEIHAARNRLIAEIERLRQENEIDEKRIAGLVARLEEAEKTHRAIIEARQGIVGRTIDKDSPK
jgi:diguanylate cyclase (GGDEF)-like protein